MLNTAFKLRHLILACVHHELRAQYSKSILGTLWMVMNPLYMCIIYTAIFSSIMDIGGKKFSYVIYAATGLITWNFFTDIINRSQTIYVNYTNVIRQQNFPILCLPIVVMILSSIDFFISFGIFSVYLLITHSFPGWCILASITVLLIEAFYAIGLGTILGVLNVFFRDIGKMTTMLLQVWFWLTPIVFLMEKLPQKLQLGLMFNPLTSIMLAYQSIMVHHQLPKWEVLVYPFLAALITAFLLLRFYAKHSTDLLDE